MSGYRNQSNFDPMAHQRPGKPLRPYNWVQWIGVAMINGGALICLWFLLGELGWVPRFPHDSPMPFTVFPLVGMTLVNSRREPSTPVDETQRERNRRTLLWTTIVLVPVLLGAAILSIWGPGQ